MDDKFPLLLGTTVRNIFNHDRIGSYCYKSWDLRLEALKYKTKTD